MENNENYEICKACGGKCCKRMGCHISPNEVINRLGSITTDTILYLLNTGYVAMDWWEGDIREDDDSIPECELYDQIYFLRMRHKNEPAIYDSWGGECTCLTDTGCMLNWETRPLGGRALVPQPGFKCGETSYSKIDCVKEWIQYQDVMDEVCESVPNKLVTVETPSNDKKEYIKFYSSLYPPPKIRK